MTTLIVRPGDLLITRGLPACGKTWFATRWRDENVHARARLNRDELRKAIHGGYHDRPKNIAEWEGFILATEDQVSVAQHAAAEELLRKGVSVICDDTNLEDSRIEALGRVAQRAGAAVQIIDLRHVPLRLCLERNAVRTGDEFVNPEWIKKQWRLHIVPLRYSRTGVTSTNN